MKSLLTLLTLLTATCFAGDITGNWKGTAEGQNGPMERTFTFKQDGKKLSGETVSSFAGKSTIEDGTVDGDSVSFNINVKIQDNEMKLNYKGKVTGDKIVFKVELPGGGQSLEWKVERMK
jgi:hypothetical protein